MGLKAKLCGIFAALACMISAARAQGPTQVLPVIDVWASRTGTGIVGASTSVITADEIARSPGLTIQDVLSREVGVQTWSTTGGNNGATTTVDLRSFGATASSNTLFLLNGRRLNDIDLLGVDLSTIPKDSIETHRNQPRQQRRGPVRRWRRRWRHQYHHENRGRLAADGSNRGRLRFIQSARNKWLCGRFKRSICGIGVRKRDQFRRLPRQQRVAGAERHR
jgi:hypothetical protein